LRHRGVYTSRFPIRLWFAGVCPASPPAHAGLDPGVALRLALAPYPTVFGLLAVAGSCLDSTRFSVSCQNGGDIFIEGEIGGKRAFCGEKGLIYRHKYLLVADIGC